MEAFVLMQVNIDSANRKQYKDENPCKYKTKLRDETTCVCTHPLVILAHFGGL